MDLELSAIRTDGGTQPRAKIDAETVSEYSSAMADGSVFPPIVVFYDGSEYWLADGFHRYNAAMIAGLADIEADVKQGSIRDAVLYSVGVNSAHGLRRTNDDKRRAVLKLLEDAEWSAWSDREIARRCAVSNNFVSSMRPSICHPMTDTPTERKVERNGTIYTQDTTRIGRTRAPDPVVNEMPIDPLAADEPPPLGEGPTEQRRPSDDIQDEFTPADKAIKDIQDYIDITLDEVNTDVGRHYVVNTVLKYLRDKSISLNRSA